MDEFPTVVSKDQEPEEQLEGEGGDDEKVDGDDLADVRLERREMVKCSKHSHALSSKGFSEIVKNLQVRLKDELYASALRGVGRPTGGLNAELLCVLGVQSLPAAELHGLGGSDQLLRTWGTGCRPRLECSRQLLLARRRGEPRRAILARPGGPGPLHQRFARQMQFESPQPQVAVACFVEQSLTKRFAPHRHAWCTLEGHRPRREPPIRGSGNPARRFVVFLVARGAPSARGPAVIGPAHNTELVDMPIVSLARIVGGRVAVDASRGCEDGFNDPPFIAGRGHGDYDDWEH